VSQPRQLQTPADKTKGTATNVRGKFRTGTAHVSRAIRLKDGCRTACSAGLLFAAPRAAVQRTQFDPPDHRLRVAGGPSGSVLRNTVTRRLCSRARRAIAWGVTHGSRVGSRRGRHNHSSTQDNCQLCHSLYNFAPIPHGSPAASRQLFQLPQRRLGHGQESRARAPATNSCGACHTTNAFQHRSDETRPNPSSRALIPAAHLSLRACRRPLCLRNHLANHPGNAAPPRHAVVEPGRFNHTGISRQLSSCHKRSRADRGKGSCDT